MSDIRDLLEEAVGSYEPRGDQRAVEERIKRHGRRRRIAAGVLGIFIFLLGGALAFQAFNATEREDLTADSGTPSLGSLVLSVGVGDGTTRLYVVEPDGSGYRDAGTDGTELQIEGAMPAVSPDGARLVYVRFGAQDRGLWVSNVEGSDAARLTEATENGDQDPAWSPDGEQIVFSRNRVGHGELFIVDADGTDLRQLTTNDVGQDLEPAWSPNGRTIVFTRNSGGPIDLWAVNADGTDPRQLTSFNEQEFGGPQDADWSPDGTMIVFSARQQSSGEQPDRFDRDLWVIDVTAPETARTWRLTDSLLDEISPTWSPDGRSIAFLAGSETVPSGYPDGRGPYSSFIVDVPSGPVRVLSAPPGPPFSGTSLQWSRSLTDATMTPAIETVIVPDLIGLSRDQAVAQLESLGLTVAITVTPSENALEGTIASQDPAPGTYVDPGATVTIVASEGPVQASNILRVTCSATGPPEVRTPVVAAQTDGLHVIVDNRSDAGVILIRQPSRPWVAWSSGSYGLDDEFVLSVPPGDSYISCAPGSPSSPPPPQPIESAFQVVDDGTWVSTDISCGYDERWVFDAHGSSPQIDPNQPTAAVRAFVPGILQTDQVEPGGYPAGVFDESFIRIVRDGSLIAWVRAVPRDIGDGTHDWFLHGYACPGSGIG